MQQLRATLEKGTVGNGWDMVCSYGTDALNRVLAEAHQGGAPAKELKIRLDEVDVTGAPHTIAFDLEIEAPSLEFPLEMSSHGRLTTPIRSLAWTIARDGRTPPPGSLPSGHSLVALVPLAAMRGDGAIVRQGSVVTFEDGKPEQAHVVLHFKGGQGSDASYSIVPPDPRADVLFSHLRAYFTSEVDEVGYALTGLTNVPPAGAPGEA